MLNRTIRVQIIHHFFGTYAQSFCPEKIIFVPDIKLFVADKNFCSKLKVYIFACEMYGKWLFGHTKIFPVEKSFFIFFTSKNVHFLLRTKFFVWDKNNFVWAEGWGIRKWYEQRLVESFRETTRRELNPQPWGPCSGVTSLRVLGHKPKRSPSKGVPMLQIR